MKNRPQLKTTFTDNIHLYQIMEARFRHWIKN